MQHASVRAVGDVAGGPDQIPLAVKDAPTADGTLIMCASCPSYYDEVGRGHLKPEQQREIVEKFPAFDPFTAAQDSAEVATATQPSSMMWRAGLLKVRLRRRE